MKEVQSEGETADRGGERWNRRGEDKDTRNWGKEGKDKEKTFKPPIKKEERGDWARARKGSVIAQKKRV